MTAVALTATAMVTAPASAKTITLHYFLKQVTVKFTDAAGHAKNHHKQPATGDIGDQIGLGYAGNHNNHAKRWTVSFHLRCVFRSSKRARCDAQLAVGGSMLLFNGTSPNFGDKVNRLTINGGTGVFQRAHGTMTAVSPGKNLDVTIRVRV
ncbi:MAG TPA: hypothetical protein VIX82_09380 [Solirubrobacteraceae bacterium]